MTNAHKTPYAVVAISIHGYSVISRHEDRSVAADAALAHFRKFGNSAVLRDGTTGKRFSIAELEGGNPWLT